MKWWHFVGLLFWSIVSRPVIPRPLSLLLTHHGRARPIQFETTDFTKIGYHHMDDLEKWIEYRLSMRWLILWLASCILTASSICRLAPYKTHKMVSCPQYGNHKFRQWFPLITTKCLLHAKIPENTYRWNKLKHEKVNAIVNLRNYI